MKFLLKKIKKFLSASLVMSSLCLSPVNQVSARLEGRVATAEDFEKFTSELEKMFEERLDGKWSSSLDFSYAALKILEDMGIQSGVVMIEKSRGPILGKVFDKHSVVIYPLQNDRNEFSFVILDTIEAFCCYHCRNNRSMKKNLNSYIYSAEKEFLDKFVVRKFRYKGQGFVLNSWKDLCYFNVFKYLSGNVFLEYESPNEKSSHSGSSLNPKVFVKADNPGSGNLSLEEWILKARGLIGKRSGNYSTEMMFSIGEKRKKLYEEERKKLNEKIEEKLKKLNEEIEEKLKKLNEKIEENYKKLDGGFDDILEYIKKCLESIKKIDNTIREFGYKEICHEHDTYGLLSKKYYKKFKGKIGDMLDNMFDKATKYVKDMFGKRYSEKDYGKFCVELDKFINKLNNICAKYKLNMFYDFRLKFHDFIVNIKCIK